MVSRMPGFAVLGLSQQGPWPRVSASYHVICTSCSGQTQSCAGFTTGEQGILCKLPATHVHSGFTFAAQHIFPDTLPERLSSYPSILCLNAHPEVGSCYCLKALVIIYISYTNLFLFICFPFHSLSSNKAKIANIHPPHLIVPK
jgi:hypothetical protein